MDDLTKVNNYICTVYLYYLNNFLRFQMKKQYTDAFKNAEEAQIKYQKADLDMTLSANEVERKKSNYHSKLKFCDDAQAAYASQLCQTNELQIRHYNTMLPNVLNVSYSYSC